LAEETGEISFRSYENPDSFADNPMCLLLDGIHIRKSAKSTRGENKSAIISIDADS
jgi:hypothetical protein